MSSIGNYVKQIPHILLLFHTIVKVVRMKSFSYAKSMMVVVTTYVDEPIVIVR